MSFSSSVGTQSYACSIHGPITFPGNQPRNDHNQGLDGFIKALINTDAMQRLRWIRQNGLAHFVFNTMEHSRFAHSLGVAFVARRMIDRILLNSGLENEEDAWTWKYETIAAALLHDIGHGPFSHSLEEILRAIHPNLPSDQQFDHEHMTLRLIQENTQVNEALKKCNADLPERIAQFFMKKKDRKKDHWRYRIVSSQLDADRLDYILRDARMAGLKGAGFDLERILQHLYVKAPEDEHFILDRKAIEALEATLLVNDQLYRAVYYHRKVRAATAMMQILLLRVAHLAIKDGEVQGQAQELFKRDNHPLLQLMQLGRDVNLEAYLNLTENHIWALIEEWRNYSDQIVQDYAHRLWERRLHSAVEISGHDDGRRKEEEALQALLKEFNRGNLHQTEEDLRRYYVLSDTSRRKSYKEGDSIYLGTQNEPNEKPNTLEFDQSSRIVYMLREQHKIEYVIYPHQHSQEDSSSSAASVMEFNSELVSTETIDKDNQASSNGNSSLSESSSK
ncbi:HD domain-containing protein [Cyanobacteria bacterium FACHB-63]|nr:HD domain-containing protein [Cyanobacteria bacterium FACHB-63]